MLLQESLDSGSSRVYAVIVNFNSTADLAICVEALLKNEVALIQIVDNASAESDRVSLQRLTEDWPVERVSVSFGASNLGFGGGVNQGYELVKSVIRDEDFLWLVNPDIVAPAATAALLLSTALASNAAIVSPLITSDNIAGDYWFAGGEVSEGRGRVIQHMSTERAQAGDRAIATQFVTGAAMMVSVREWRLLLGMREDLFLYWEDADFSLRASRQGLAMLVSENATVWHRVGGSSGVQPKNANYFYYVARNRLLVCASGGWSRLRLAVGSAGVETLHLLWWASKMGPGRLRRFGAIAQGTLEGVRGISGQRGSLRIW